MKYRILNNNLCGGVYPLNFEKEGWFFTTIIPSEELIKPIWDKDLLVWIEGVTQEEIDDYNDKLQQQALDAFMLQKETDGGTYYKDMDKRITTNLSTLDRNILFPILGEIESCLQPPLSKIKTGDFASALYIFESQNLPTNSFVLDFYNEAKLYCEEYYDTKYPK